VCEESVNARVLGSAKRVQVDGCAQGVTFEFGARSRAGFSPRPHSQFNPTAAHRSAPGQIISRSLGGAALGHGCLLADALHAEGLVDRDADALLLGRGLHPAGAGRWGHVLRMCCQDLHVEFGAALAEGEPLLLRT